MTFNSYNTVFHPLQQYFLKKILIWFALCSDPFGEWKKTIKLMRGEKDFASDILYIGARVLSFSGCERKEERASFLYNVLFLSQMFHTVLSFDS